MENLNATFKNGNLYDLNTKKRIHLRDNAKIVIVGIKENFLDEDPLKNKINVLEEKDKLEQVEKIKDLLEYKKILKKDTVLFFNISLKLKPNDKKIDSQFKVKLLEDLYVYRRKGWKENKNQLFDCACKLIENTTNDIDFFEELKGYSLNNIYETTYVTYFAKQGSSTANVFKRFYTDQDNNKTIIDELRYGKYIKPNKIKNNIINQGKQMKLL